MIAGNLLRFWEGNRINKTKGNKDKTIRPALPPAKDVDKTAGAISILRERRFKKNLKPSYQAVDFFTIRVYNIWC